MTLVCDGQGAPLATRIGPGQEHDLRRFHATVEDALRLARPKRLAADKAYSVVAIRRWLRRRRIAPVIPFRRDQKRSGRFDRRAYRRRNVIERLVGWLKESRRVATRYEKLAATFLAFVKLAMVRRLLRLVEFSNRP